MPRKCFLTFCWFTIGSLTGFSQIEPQFKFYLAFEDAKNEKDTLWMGLDSSATFYSDDTIFGDTLVPIDTSIFQVFFNYGLNSDSTCRKTIFENTESKLFDRNIQGFSNFELPITIRWDREAFSNNELPFELYTANLYSTYISIEGFAGGFPLNNAQDLELDSLVLPEYFPESHLPISVTISNTKNPSLTINQPNVKLINIYPNPATERITVALKHIEHGVVRITDQLGRIVLEQQIFDGVNELSIRHIPAGVYAIQVSDGLEFRRSSKLVVQ